MSAYGIEWLSTLAHPEIVRIWTPKHNIMLERALWVAVMFEQEKLGVAIPEDAIKASTVQISTCTAKTMRRIDERERITRHDVKARLEIFCEDAGHEFHHLGMTSADIVDNVMQIRLRDSVRMLTYLYGEDPVLQQLLDRYAFRGIKGAVGTQQDQLDLLGSSDACRTLDREVAQTLGFKRVMTSTGQVYPRSQDLEVLSTTLTRVAFRPGFDRGWMGAMAGYQAMAAEYSGDQWNEGDVSTSVVRRVCLPGFFLAASAGLEHLAKKATVC